MTDQELKDLAANLVISTIELKDSTAELRASIAELREFQRETALQMKETDRRINQTNKQLGELGNKFGSFAEGMALPSMEKILKRKFDATVVNPNAKSSINGQSMEIDVLAYDKSGRDEVYLVEVKSHLTPDGINQMLKAIEDFPKFFPNLAHRKIYGIIAAVTMPDNLRNEVLSKGLYLAQISDDTFRLRVPRNFKPRDFNKASKQNGNARRSTNSRREK
jgi:hypothetical protein